MNNEKLINDFVRSLRSKRKSSSTILAYTKDLSQLAESSGKSLTKVESDDIRKFIAEINLTPKTISRKLNSFRTFYRFLLEQKSINKNPAMDVAHPKFESPKPRVLSAIEYLALRQVSKDNMRLYTMIELMLQTGIRIGELSRIRLGDLDIKKTKGYLNIQEFSTNPTRTIELNNAAMELLTNYVNTLPRQSKSTPLFSTRDGKPIIIRNIRSSIDRAIAKAGIKDACVNDLRNTFIVYQLSKNVPVEKVTEVVGHKSRSTTMRYIELLSSPYRAKSSAKISDL